MIHMHYQIEYAPGCNVVYVNVLTVALLNQVLTVQLKIAKPTCLGLTGLW